MVDTLYIAQNFLWSPDIIILKVSRFYLLTLRFNDFYNVSSYFSVISPFSPASFLYNVSLNLYLTHSVLASILQYQFKRMLATFLLLKAN